MEIIVDVVNQRLKLSANYKDYVEGSQNFVRFMFKFTENWNGLKVFAQFYQDGNTYDVFLDSDNSVYLPREITNGTCTMSLYGTNGKIIGTTNHVQLRIDKGIVENTDNVEISSSLYNQLVAQQIDHETWVSDSLSWGEF